MGKLEGKVAIVTGSARGMGAATARLFVAEGARVLVTDVLEKEGLQTAKDIGDAARFQALDVTDESSWTAAVKACQAAFGRLDVLVNNAGILHNATTLETEPAAFRKVLDVNLVGPFLGIRACAPIMAETGGGAIVNISSVQGMLGRAGTPAYTASKFGVRGLTKTVALELGELGIRVNSVHPGGVDTPLIRLGSGADLPTEILDKAHGQLPIPRVGQPEDIARATLYLASDDASYVTGTELVVDGGLTAGYRAGRTTL
jgi:3alpha(or 20beta)-hydroxysteroid dehydrogenase